MSEVQQLETSVMVTERNWSALLEMQDRLFRQQMQLDTDLKMLLTKAEAQESLIKMQTSAENFEKQAGSLSAGVFFRLQRADQQCSLGYDYDSGRCEEAAFRYDTESSKENPPLRVGLDYGGDLVRGAVRLGRAVEQMTDDAPTHDGTTTPPHRQQAPQKAPAKKTALGHAEDDHEEMRMDTM